MKSSLLFFSLAVQSGLSAIFYGLHLSKTEPPSYNVVEVKNIGWFGNVCIELNDAGEGFYIAKDRIRSPFQFQIGTDDYELSEIWQKFKINQTSPFAGYVKGSSGNPVLYVYHYFPFSRKSFEFNKNFASRAIDDL